MKNVSAHSAKSPANWLVNPFTDWKANLVSAIQNGTRGLFVCAALIVVLAFALPLAAQAQNTSSSPYYNSWHQYAVIPMGNTGNTYEWRIYNNEANALAYAAISNPSSYELTEPLSWVQNRTTASGNAYIEIYFDKTILAPGTWYLVYSEFSASTGTCVARRSMAITPVDNTLYFSMGVDASDCHPLDGEVRNWNDLNGIPQSVPLEFTVTLHKTYNFNIKSYTFSGTVATTDYTFTGVTLGTVGGVALAASDYSITTDVGAKTFSVTILADPPYDSGSTADATVNIVLQVAVSGLVYVGDDVKVTLTGGSATSGNSYDVITDVVHPPPSGTDQDQQLTILPLPATPNIAIVD